MVERERRKELSPSQKLRAVIYRHYEFDRPNCEFEKYYEEKMKALTHAIGRKLDQKKLDELAREE